LRVVDALYLAYLIFVGYTSVSTNIYS
jgi:hypothetical protein